MCSECEFVCDLWDFTFYCTSYHIKPIQITHQDDTTHNFSSSSMTLRSFIASSSTSSSRVSSLARLQHKVCFFLCRATEPTTTIGYWGEEENVVKSTLLLCLSSNGFKSVEINDLVSNHQILTLMFALQIVSSPRLTLNSISLAYMKFNKFEYTWKLWIFGHERIWKNYFIVRTKRIIKHQIVLQERYNLQLFTVYIQMQIKSPKQSWSVSGVFRFGLIRSSAIKVNMLSIKICFKLTLAGFTSR